MATNSDQDDIVAQNERLTAHLAASRQHASELNSPLDALRAEHQLAKPQIDQLRTELYTARQTLADRTKERDALQTENDNPGPAQ
jgi:chromosome segregation ATPase